MLLKPQKTACTSIYSIPPASENKWQGPMYTCVQEVQANPGPQPNLSDASDRRDAELFIVFYR